MKKRALWLVVILVLSLTALAVFGNLRFFFGHQEPAPLRSALIKDFVQLYHTDLNLHRQTRWLGVKITQSPTDMWAVQEIINDVRPDFVIETGTYRGGAALYYATLLKAIGNGGKVITVDIAPRTEIAGKHNTFREDVIVITGNSVSEDVISRIRSLVGGRTALVTLDSDHHMSHVLKEMELYSNFVSVGSYLIVQDTFMNGHPVLPEFGPGPMEAVEEFLKKDTRFLTDRSKEKFLLTFYPKGYLKRIK